MHVLKAWVGWNNIVKGKLVVFALSNLKRTIEMLPIKSVLIVDEEKPSQWWESSWRPPRRRGQRRTCPPPWTTQSSTCSVSHPRPETGKWWFWTLLGEEVVCGIAQIWNVYPHRTQSPSNTEQNSQLVTSGAIYRLVPTRVFGAMSISLVSLSNLSEIILYRTPSCDHLRRQKVCAHEWWKFVRFWKCKYENIKVNVKEPDCEAKVCNCATSVSFHQNVLRLDVPVKMIMREMAAKLKELWDQISLSCPPTWNWRIYGIKLIIVSTCEQWLASLWCQRSRCEDEKGPGILNV